MINKLRNEKICARRLGKLNNKMNKVKIVKLALKRIIIY